MYNLGLTPKIIDIVIFKVVQESKRVQWNPIVGSNPCAGIFPKISIRIGPFLGPFGFLQRKVPIRETGIERSNSVIEGQQYTLDESLPRAVVLIDSLGYRPTPDKSKS